MNAANVDDEDLSAEQHRAPVQVSLVGSRLEADLIVGLLRSNGLNASAAGDDAGGFEPEWELSGVRVLVAASDAESARAVLAEQAPGALGEG
jgi:Putative prokaryotic signal transducing protein